MHNNDLCEVCKQIYDKKEDGVNSLQTLNPDGHIKEYCAKFSDKDFLIKIRICIRSHYISKNMTILIASYSLSYNTKRHSPLVKTGECKKFTLSPELIS